LLRAERASHSSDGRSARKESEMMKTVTRMLPVLLVLLASTAWADHERADEWNRYDPPDDSPEHAEYEDPDARQHELDPLGVGPYLGLSFIVAPEAYRNGARRNIGGNRNVDSSVGFGARIGHRFHPHLAVEIQSEWIEGYDLQQFPGDHSEIRTWTTTANGKFFFGHGRLQPYLLAGLGLQRAWVRNPTPGGVNFDDVAFVGRVGGGVELELTSHVAVVLETTYLAPTGDLDDYDTVSVGLGLNYRF
jgi:opacity protein-like surface antigen